MLNKTQLFHTPTSSQQSSNVGTPLAAPILLVQSIHVDELLCFFQNRINSDNLENIVKTCVDFYSEADIAQINKTVA